MTSQELRYKFLKFFQEHGHHKVPSGSLVPADDPTLIFTNAGMNQFKNIFLGHTKASHPRAVSVQKCVRAGGKHNDLDNVGFTARHHTFFEMLGNFSFGDYFKAEAIEYAWQFVTHTLGLPKDRLYVSVFRDDHESAKLWTTVAGVDKQRIYAFGEDDNFWRMGATGPCGPCSEIFFDLRPEAPGEPMREMGDRCIEIWNLVFMQFNESLEGRTLLPRPCVDTGMGLERVAAVLQGKLNNYHSDIFKPLIDTIQSLSGRKFVEDLSTVSGPELENQKALNASFCVLADHIRAVCFLIGDGVLPSNDGRGYVLRRILRRATRFEKKLEAKCFLPMVEVLVKQMRGVYPELEQNKKVILNTIQSEQARFLKTLDSGILLLNKLLQAVKSKGLTQLDGPSVFKLYDTYGFPPDLTQLIAQEQGVAADLKGFEKLQASHRNKESFARAKKSPATLDFWVKGLGGEYATTQFVGHNTLELEASEALTQSSEALPQGLDVFKNFKQKLQPCALAKRAQDFTNSIFKNIKPLGQGTRSSQVHTPQHNTTSTSTNCVLGVLRIISQDNKKINSKQSFIHEQSVEEYSLSEGQTGHVIVGPQTCFYAESGGQVGDTGELIGLDKGLKLGNPHGNSKGEAGLCLPPVGHSYQNCRAKVVDCKKHGDFHVLEVKIIKGTLLKGQAVTQRVDAGRRLATAKNHSATHLMHAALRKVLGDHITQAGSLVAPDRLRFDFTHSKPVTPNELRQVEQYVNEQIAANHPVTTQTLDYKTATAPASEGGAGALALFGEKYGDTVRVLTMGGPSYTPHTSTPPQPSDAHAATGNNNTVSDAHAADGNNTTHNRNTSSTKPNFSVELCGGTHVSSTGIIGAFVLISETGIGSGVRRVEALTGAPALAFLQHHRFENEQLRSKMGLPAVTLAAVERHSAKGSPHPPEKLAPTKQAHPSVAATVQQYEKLKSKLAQLDEQHTQSLVQWKTASLTPAACHKFQYNNIGCVFVRTDIQAPKVLQLMAEKLGPTQLSRLNLHEVQAVVVAGQGDKKYPVVVRSLVEACSAREVLKFVCQNLGGKGGGRDQLAQGILNSLDTSKFK